jgi:hypothetical protein
MRYISNAFSLNMVAADTQLTISKAGAIPADAKSCVGHESTAKVFSVLLGRDIPFNREAISLEKGDELYVGALFTPDGKPFRPPEGQVLTLEALKEVVISWRCIRVGTPGVPKISSMEEEIFRSREWANKPIRETGGSGPFKMVPDGEFVIPVDEVHFVLSEVASSDNRQQVLAVVKADPETVMVSRYTRFLPLARHEGEDVCPYCGYNHSRWTPRQGIDCAGCGGN